MLILLKNHWELLTCTEKASKYLQEDTDKC